ncbi:hypothetical protein QTP70_027464, partial [Hemibagrus guttatus]
MCVMMCNDVYWCVIVCIVCNDVYWCVY